MKVTKVTIKVTKATMKVTKATMKVTKVTIKVTKGTDKMSLSTEIQKNVNQLNNLNRKVMEDFLNKIFRGHICVNE